MIKAGFSGQEVDQLLRKAPWKKAPTLSSKMTYLRARNARRGQIGLKVFFPHETRRSLFFFKNGKKLSTTWHTENFRIRTRRVDGRVYGSLVSSIQKKLNNTQVAYRFLDAYKLYFEPRKKLQRGDRFGFIVEELFLGRHFIGYGELLKTELQVRGKWHRREFLPKSDGGVFMTAAKERLKEKSRFLYSPVKYLRISSLFNPRRLHPIKKRRQPHMGIDFALPTGSPIYAAHSGHVVRMGRARASGKYVVLRNSNGLETYYNHLDEHQKGLHKGQYLKVGQKVGTIGCTGYCTRPHLHFAVRRNGRYVNPAPLLKSYPWAYAKDL